MPVALTGEQIRQRLTEFAGGWSVYDGSERSGAHTFLDELFRCYGTERKGVATFEEPQAGKFVDLAWPGVCIIEMKRPSEGKNLSAHRDQALGYWRQAARPERNVPAPPYVVICSFNRLEVWEPGRFPRAPRAALPLVELPDRYETLLFLAGREPVFVGGQEAVTREAVGKVIDLYGHLRDRRAADLETLRDFVMQTVWCMFAEDLGQLEAQLFTRILDRLLADTQRSSVDDLGQLFTYLNTGSGGPAQGLYAGVRYVNGALFADPARVHLEPEELELLREAAGYDWHRIQPSIFGSLMEGGLGHDIQWALGAHYTHEADIQKVIGPSIVEPWRERIENVTTPAEARAAQNDLMQYVVLDPACGSGNFLYLSYRELRRLEHRLREREAELRSKAGLGEQGALSLFFPLTNIRGIERDGFAARIARMTLWMGHKLAVDELSLDEATLPLADLHGIQVGDALRVPWPRASVIVGNPPFHGDRFLRRVFGDDYVEWLRRQFGIGVKDYCVYWFRKAHEHLERGQRAGLVGTNSVSQGRARPVSLGYIVDEGGVITDAVSTQPWPGEATVEVSIVNWVKQPAREEEVKRVLDGQLLDEPIAPSLVPLSFSVDSAVPLAANAGRAFFPCILGAGGSGFILMDEEAQKLLAKGPEWSQVVRPLLIGEDLTQRPDHSPGRWVIDFGFMTLEEARAYPEALEIVRARVKPARDKVKRAGYRRNWWRFAEPIRAMRSAIEGLPRYIACPALTSGRGGFCWVDPWAIPTGQAPVCAFDDDYAIGVLNSAIHEHWARARSSTFRTDFRYTPSSAFASFPWPAPPDSRREQVARCARRVVERRDEICRHEAIGITTLYELVREGAYVDLSGLHRKLDRAVAEAYGWPSSVASEARETNSRLLELNQRIAAGDLAYRGPG
jgi:hypothetical protein